MMNGQGETMVQEDTNLQKSKHNSLKNISKTDQDEKINEVAVSGKADCTSNQVPVAIDSPSLKSIQKLIGEPDGNEDSLKNEPD